MTSEIKAAIRLKRLMSSLDISNASRHGQRLGKIAHVDPARSHMNRHWSYQAGRLVQVSAAPDLAPALERRREDREATRRANTPTLASEIMFITSRAAFLNAAGEVDNERAYAWADQMLAAFEERFPGMTAAARLDLDERTPHLSIFAVPIYMKEANKPRADVSEDARARRKPRAPKPTVSHKQVFGGIEEMRILQRWVQGLNADFLAPFGLEVSASTPRTQSGANHIHPDDFRRLMKNVERLENEARAAAEKLLADAQDNAAEMQASIRAEQKEIARDAALKAKEAADAILTAAHTAAETIRGAAEANADTIKAEAEAERDAARDAARDARQAAENAAAEAKALLDVVRPATSMKPLKDAYEALLDGSNLTPRQALAAETAADEDRKWINFHPVAFPREGADREDRDAAVWLAHPEVAAEVKSASPDPLLADLIEPASGSTTFRARFFSKFRGLRDLVMQAVEKVVQRHISLGQQKARKRMEADPYFKASAQLGYRLVHDDPWNDLRRQIDGDDPTRSKSEKHKADYREAEHLNAGQSASAVREVLYAEAQDHARAAAVLAARIERGPRQIAQWLSIPSGLRQTFTAALDAAAALETALARRNAPAAALEGTVEAQEPRPSGRTPGGPSSGL